MFKLYFKTQRVPDYIVKVENCGIVFGALVTLVYKFHGEYHVVPFLGIYAFGLIDIESTSVLYAPGDDVLLHTRYLFKWLR